MSVSQGFGKSVTNGLVFQYDLGDMVNSYKGIPKQNLLSYFSRTYGETNNADFKTHYYTTTVNVPQMGNISVENIDTYNTGANVCCEQCWYFGSPAVAGNTTYTYSIVYKSTTNYTHPNFMYHYQYGASGYITEYGLHNDSNRTHLGDGWYHAWGTFTTNANTTYLNCYFYMYEYNAYNTISVAGVMLVQGNVIIPPKQFLGFGASRSNTTSLLPLKGPYTINLANVTFDGGGKMYFDGTNDYIQVSYSESVSNAVSRSWEAVVKPTSTQTSSAIFGQKISSGCTYFCNGGLYISSGKWAFNWYDNVSYQFMDSGISATSNTTYHIVGTYDATDQKPRIYVNGNLVATYGLATNMNYAGSVGLIDIGWTSASGGFDYFLGEMPVIKYYSGKALSLTEVKQNYNIYKSRFNLT